MMFPALSETHNFEVLIEGLPEWVIYNGRPIEFYVARLLATDLEHFSNSGKCNTLV